MVAQTKFTKELFSKFFEEPSRDILREVLRQHVGETRNIDFKTAWPDHPGLAKQCLGMANSEGGCLIIGMREDDDKSLTAIGLEAFVDKADIHNGLKSYIPNELRTRIEILDFDYRATEYAEIAGKKFQVALIDHGVEHAPFVSLRAGTGIRASAIYVRREASTEEANYDELQGIINRRIGSGNSTSGEQNLKKELELLRTLYGEIPARVSSLSGFLTMGSSIGFDRPNPKYPEGGIDAFILDLIVLKQGRIASMLGVGKEYAATYRAKETLKRFLPSASITRATPAQVVPSSADVAPPEPARARPARPIPRSDDKKDA